MQRACNNGSKLLGAGLMEKGAGEDKTGKTMVSTSQRLVCLTGQMWQVHLSVQLWLGQCEREQRGQGSG